jgi:hypothetical protein
MQTNERGEDDEPVAPAPYVDFAWGRTANPNTADGELQNIAAFGAGLSRLTGSRRRVARVLVWLLLIGFAVGIALSVLGIVGTW